MNTLPRISIIVPVYNAAKFLTRCCDSLVRQSYPQERYEVFLVDNNSKDTSAKIAAAYRDRGELQLLSETEQGSYAARNLALRNATGEILAFTDPDCVPREDWLERIESTMRSPETKIVLGGRLFASSTGTLGRLEAYESAMAAHVYAKGQAEHYFAYTNNMAIRREVFDHIGEFEQIQRGADSRFLHRAMKALGGPGIVRYDPEIVVQHLEIEGITDYLEKKLAYGRVTGSHQGRLDFPAGLSFRERVDLARSVVRDHPVASTVGFGAVLAAGSVLFEWSRRRAERRKK